MFLFILFLLVTLSVVFILFRRKEVLSEQSNKTTTINLEEIVETTNDDDFEFFVHSYLTDFFADRNNANSSKAKLDIPELLNSRMNYLEGILNSEALLKKQSEKQLFKYLLAIEAFLKKSNKHKTRRHFKKKTKHLKEGIDYACSTGQALYIFFMPFNPNCVDSGTYFDVLTNLLFVEAYEHLSDKNKDEIENLFFKMAPIRMELREHILNIAEISSRIDRLDNFQKVNQTLIDACG